MTFKPAFWRPVAFVLSAINLVAVGFASGEAEPWHAGGHAALALAFGLWAQRMHRAPAGRSELEAGGDLPARLDALETEVGTMQRELSEAHERLDFAERLLAQRQESPRVGPER